jgi:Ribbon-helix-helix protein, copG family
MPLTRKHCAKEDKKLRKRQDKKLDNVISVRISDQEKHLLQRIIRRTSKNASDIMREAILLWSSRQRNLCLD